MTLLWTNGVVQMLQSDKFHGRKRMDMFKKLSKSKKIDGLTSLLDVIVFENQPIGNVV